MKAFKFIFLLMIGVGVLNSCNLTDTDEPCESIVTIHMEYKFNGNPSGGRPIEPTPLSDLVDYVQLFIFDENEGNVLKYIVPVAHASVVEGKLPIDLLTGRYTMVAWGLSRNSHPNGGFAAVQMLDPATNYYTPVVIGKTTLDDFRLLITDAEDPTFADLFHAEATSVNVPVATTETQMVEVDFNFVRYSKTIQVTVNGINYIDDILHKSKQMTRADSDLPLDIYISGKNGVFQHDGSIDANARELKYNDMPVSQTATQAVVDIKTLKLDVRRHTGDPVMLNIHNANGVTDEEIHSIVPDLDLVKLIREVKDNQGNYLYYTQDQIDQADVIPVDVNIRRVPDPGEEDGYSLEVIITINGWTVYEVEDLQVYV